MEQLLSLNFNLPNTLKKVLNKIVKYGGVPILVGGIVRDSFLNIPSKDYDIEVYSIDNVDKLSNIIEEFGDINIVGVSFGIVKLKLDDIDIDFSFPRLESKNGLGHRGFKIIIDSNLKYKDAAKRRDFTINSIGYDYKNNKLLDPFNGIKDIKNKVLKYVDKDSFKEDCLRVYRAVQFCARFEFKLDIDTSKLCKEIVKYDEFKLLSKERIFEEYKKLLLKSDKPSLGLKVLKEFGLISINSNVLIDIDNISKYKCKEIKTNLILMFYFIYDILIDIADDKKLIRDIENLKNFIVPNIYKFKIKNITNKAELVYKKLEMMQNMPKAFIEGRDLITLGFKPSVEFKNILNNLYQKQLDGTIKSKQEAIDSLFL